MAQAVEIVTNCIDRREQGRQLSFLREAQGAAIAPPAHDQEKAAGGVKNN